MSALRGIPRAVRLPARLGLLGLLGLLVTVPFSAPDGTGMQWDELVLAATAATAAVLIARRVREMDAGAARPWRLLAIGSGLFAFAQLLSGAFPGPAFDGFDVDDVILFVGASTPLVTCALLARQATRTRWTALMVDGAVVTTALVTVTEVLRAPLVSAAGAPEDLRGLVLAYGGYAALVLGGAGVLCTVSTAELRRSATLMLTAVGWQAAAAVGESMAIVSPSALWTGVSDVAVLLSLQATVLAALRAPAQGSDRVGRATAQVNRGGMLLVAAAVLALPAALLFCMAMGDPPSPAARIGIAIVFVLTAVRMVLRIVEDGRVSEDLVRGEEDFRDLVESSSDGIAVVDADLRLLFASPAARTLLGVPATAVGRTGLLDPVDPEDRPHLRAAVFLGRAAVHFRVVTEDGGRRELEVSTSLRPGSGRRVLYLRDITSRRRRERELERMAFTDSLTGLPNRAMFFRELADGLDDGIAGERCLLVLDLDGFKAVNDVAGHEAGDHLLVEVARRLGAVVREQDLVARLGGDEFAVLAGGTLEEAVEIATRVVDALAVPHRSGEWAFAVGASVGVTVLHAGGGQVAFREADDALRVAKAAGKGCVRVAGEDVRGLSEGPAIGLGLTDGSLEVRYDVAVDADGTAALLSAVPAWRHGVLGAVPRQELWAAAERQGRTVDLIRWLLRTACAEVAALDDALPVAVALPPGHWSPEGLADDVRASLAGARLPADRLVLALTEEALVASTAALLPELHAVEQTGVRLMLDGYGMGHTLFALLARAPLGAVRVDLAALRVRDDAGRALRAFTSISRTAAEFGLLSIADGVDDEADLRAARASGAVLAQGRHLPSLLGRRDVQRLLAGLAPLST